MDNPRRKDKSEEFATANPFKLIVKYSIPTVAGMLVNALYVLIDRIFVSHLPGGIGELGMAGINIAMPVTIIIFAVAMFAGAGAAANISLCLGRGDKDKAEKFIGNGLFLGVTVALVCSILFHVFRGPVLTAFGGAGNAQEARQYAEQYLSVMLIGTTVNTFGFCLSRYILAQGYTTVSMASMILGVTVNLALAPLFLFVFGWGVAGSAVATVIAQSASAAFSLIWFLRKRMPLAIRVRYLKPELPVVGSIASIGISPGSLQLAMSFVMIILNSALQRYGGVSAMAAMGAVTSIAQVVLMPIYGLNQGVQPIIGFNYGARQYHRVRALLIQAVRIAVTVMAAFWIVLMLGARQVMLVFGEANAGMMELGPAAMRCYMMLLPLVGFQVVAANYFQAVGKPVHSLVLVLLRQVLILIPAVLTLPLLLGLNGVFLAAPVSDFLSTCVTGTFLLFELRKLNAQAREESGRAPEEAPALEAAQRP